MTETTTNPAAKDLIVKIQTDHTGKRVLIYDVPEQTFQVEQGGTIALEIADAYGIPALSKIYATASVTEDGILQLGERVDFDEEAGRVRSN